MMQKTSKRTLVFLLIGLFIESNSKQEDQFLTGKLEDFFAFIFALYRGMIGIKAALTMCESMQSE
ncbi:hypothetical protein [Klebsiella pneumoniae]|uniref:hypothetical protein n=1 Tax=Klebsiella pneumoniae TaxID=573 RepID=UPI001090CDD4|nr:hypothetical protein [Klebsiella pneumoniae]